MSRCFSCVDEFRLAVSLILETRRDLDDISLDIYDAVVCCFDPNSIRDISNTLTHSRFSKMPIRSDGSAPATIFKGIHLPICGKDLSMYRFAITVASVIAGEVHTIINIDLINHQISAHYSLNLDDFRYPQLTI